MNEGWRRSNVLLFALLALFGVSYVSVSTQQRLAQGGAGTTKEPQEAKRDAPAGPARGGSADRGQEQCRAGPGPMQFLCGYFAQWQRGPGRMKDWRAAPWAEEARRGTVDLSFLIAIVPDPETTRLALYFDRSLSSIQTGVASTGYRFDSLWVPWRQGGADADSGQETAREPGVMIFRKEGDKTLAVFLVGESPVSGIRRVPFRNALYYISELSPKLERVRIIGPNFSGSFPSLRRELEAAVESGELRSVPRFRVISPNSTVRKAQCGFGWPREGNAAVEYASLLHHDDAAMLQLGRYLEDHWGRRLRSAFIAEGETVFGLQKTPQKTEVHENAPAACQAADAAFATFLDGKKLNFPREISLLRNLYPDAGRQAFARAPGSAQERAAADLKLRSGGRGALPVFAEQQTVASQEAQLLQIAQTLDRDGDQIGGLVATDVLDMIYLASYFRQAAPNVRLYLLDADLLLVRATASYPLDGTLLVTDFPLLPDNRVWTGGGDRTPFASRWEMSTYNAARAQVLEAQGNGPGPLLEYGSPFDAKLGRPPLWLMVVSQDSLWPVALLGGDEQPGRASLQLTSHAGGGRAEGIQKPSLAWKALLVALAALGFGCALCLIAAQLPAGAKAAWLEFFRLQAGAPGTAGRAYYLLSACLLLAALLLLHVTPLIAAPDLTGTFRQYLWLAYGALGLLGLAGCAALYHGVAHRMTPPRADSNESGPLRDAYGALGIAAVILFCGFSIAWLEIFHSGSVTGHEVFFRAYRGLNVLSGVSPVLPFQLLALALLGMFALHMRRHNLFMGEHPFLPDSGGDVFLPRAAKAGDRLWTLLSWPLMGFGAAPFVFTTALISLMIPYILSGPQSLEGNAYDWLYIAMLTFAITLALQTWVRFLLVWAELRALLDSLEAHPLRDTFSALPPEFSDVPLFGGADRYSPGLVFARSLEVLRALRSHWNRESGPFFESDEQLQILEDKVRAFLSGAARCREIDHELKKTADKLFVWLGEQWKKEHSARETKREEVESAQALAEEFIALRYTAYIRHVMLHLRNLLFFLTLGFFLMVTSGLVYPFRSQNLLGWSATGSFILLGLPVAWALVQMDRNRLLQRLSSTDGSQGSGRYLLRALVLGVPPLVAIAGTHFPALSRYVSNWLAPALQALSK